MPPLNSLHFLSSLTSNFKQGTFKNQEKKPGFLLKIEGVNRLASASFKSSTILDIKIWKGTSPVKGFGALPNLF